MADELDEILDLMQGRAKRVRESGALPSIPMEGDSGADRNIRPGDLIGDDCVVERVLSRRSGSEVLLVRHCTLDRPFIVKFLPASLLGDERELSRFRQATQASSLLGHENIAYVTAYGVSPWFGHYCMMEYLNGDTLATRLKSGERLPVIDVLDIAASVGSALASVHDLGVVHRDVRPGNLIAHASGGHDHWKLLGFGLSSEQLRKDPSQDGALYVAPEVAIGTNDGPLTDQFSFAATLYHALLGAPPWPDRTWGTAGPEAWTPPTGADGLEFAPNVEDMKEVLSRALSAAPRDRFQDMDSFVMALQTASGTTRPATASPEDEHRAVPRLGDEASVAVDVGYSQPDGAPRGTSTGSTGPSVEVSFAQIEGMRMVLRMAFRTARRLRREWRRNLIAGGAFVPIERRLNPGSPVLLEIAFKPAGRAERFPGRVVRHQSEGVPGLVVEIEPEHRQALLQFISDLQLGGFDAQAVVQRRPHSPEVLDLTVDEEFVLARLSEADTVGELRRSFTNLPLPLDDVIARLEEKGWIRILGGGERARTTGELPAVPTEVGVEAVVRRADFLGEQGNYLAALETLRLGAERYSAPHLYHQLAIGRVRFQSDLPGAIEALKTAVSLAPDEETYRKTLESFQRFAQYDPDGLGGDPLA